MSRPVPLAIVCVALSLPAAAQSPRPDWDALADVETVEVLTLDADGDLRETTVWLAVVDGQGFLRTGSTTWGENVVRDPEIGVRVDGVDYLLRADFIEDEGLRERVERAFREKYGWQDSFIGFFRGDEPLIMHLLSR